MKTATILLLQKIFTDRLKKMTEIYLKWPQIISQVGQNRRISKKNRLWLQSNRRNDRSSRRKARNKKRLIRVRKIKKTRTADQGIRIGHLNITSLKLTNSSILAQNLNITSSHTSNPFQRNQNTWETTHKHLNRLSQTINIPKLVRKTTNSILQLSTMTSYLTYKASKTLNKTKNFTMTSLCSIKRLRSIETLNIMKVWSASRDDA